MEKILVTSELENSLSELNKILWGLQGEVEILYETEDARIEELLSRGDIDLCILDYEVPNYRFRRLMLFNQEHNLPTTLMIMAEPQNYASLHRDYDLSRDIVLLKPLDRSRVLFHIQRLLDDNRICETGQYKPSIQDMWRRVMPVLAALYWEETLYNRNSRRVVPYRNRSSRALFQCAIAAGIPAESQHLALPVYFFPRNLATPTGTSYINTKNIFEDLTLSVIIREDKGYSAFLSEKEQAVIFYPYDMRVSANHIAHRCYQFTQEAERQFSLSFAGVVGSPCQLEDLHSQWVKLRELAEQRRFQAESVYIQDVVLRSPNEKPLQYAPVSKWVEMILNGEKKSIVNSIQAFFEANRDNAAFTTDYIVSLVYDLDRYIGIAASQLGFEVNDLNCAKKKLMTAWKSAEDFIEWASLVTDMCIENRKRDDNQSSAIERAMVYIESNLTEDLSRNLIADHVHISQNYLARLFRKHLNMTVADYITLARINRAKDFLQKTGLNITEVSEKVGFSSSSYFASCFKKVEGISPQEYRKLHNKEAD